MMKASWEWTEDDLLELIRTPVRESITLDYKRCEALQRTDGKIKEISKDVSAFANSDGGTIVYGIIDDKNIPTGLDDGFDPAGHINKDWLDQIITSNIQRRIDGVRIHVIDLSTSKPGRVALVVSVPQSKRAPHMANDHRYYKRYNFQSVPMEDYEVRDVSHRQDGPDLEAIVSLVPTETPAALLPYWRNVSVHVALHNNSPVVANHALIGIRIDTKVSIVKQGAFSLQTEPVIDLPGLDVTAYRHLIATHGDHPQAVPLWWKGPKLNFLPIEARVAIREDAQYRLVVFLTAPAMENKLRVYLLSVQSGSLALNTT